MLKNGCSTVLAGLFGLLLPVTFVFAAAPLSSLPLCESLSPCISGKASTSGPGVTGYVLDELCLLVYNKSNGVNVIVHRPGKGNCVVPANTSTTHAFLVPRSKMAGDKYHFYLESYDGGTQCRLECVKTAGCLLTQKDHSCLFQIAPVLTLPASVAFEPAN